MSAFRYTRHSPPLRAILIRVAAFILCAVIVWSQLAIIAKKQLEGGEVVYTILMACVGFGAVIGVFFMPKMDKRFSTEGMVAICTAVFGLALMGLSQCRGPLKSIWFAGPLAAVVGFNWVIVPTNFNIATQRSVPGWIKGRAIAMYMTVLFGSFAVGSPIWGRVATAVGISNASLVAGSLILLGLLLVKVFPLTRAMGHDFAPAHRRAPAEDLALQGKLEMVIEYAIDRARTQEFAHVMRDRLRRQRLRNGAADWQLRRREPTGDLQAVVTYEESFSFGSWRDSHRFHARTTRSDAAEEAAVRDFVMDEPAVYYRAAPDPSARPTRPAEGYAGRWIPTPAPLIDWPRAATRARAELIAIYHRLITGQHRQPRRHPPARRDV